ncbi:MAG: hypothetical protein AAB319_04660, partial [Pseudomonadota bacterium]
QTRLDAVAQLQEALAARRAAGNQASISRRARLKVEWAAFHGGLKAMGRRWAIGLGLLLLLLGIVIGVWGRGLLARSAGETLQLDNLATIFGIAPYSDESPRLSRVPLRLRLDNDVEAFGHSLARLRGKRD